MSSSHNSRGFDSNHTMSSLVSGSVADESPFDHPRSSSWRSRDAFEPFSTGSRGTYSPPGKDLIEDDPFGFPSNRRAPHHDAMPSRPSLYSSSSTFSIPEELSYSHRDTIQRPTIIQHESGSRRHSQDSFGHRTGSPSSQDYPDCDVEGQLRGTEANRGSRYHTRRRPFNQDEFDGPSQYLPLPLPQQDHSRAQLLPELPVHLNPTEQDEIMRRTNNILSECAFHFISKYQFPVPLEREKPSVRTAADREWTEWAYLLKRLATKRRIPARVLYDNQIKQLVTTLENSIATRQSMNKDQGSPKRKSKDDRYILQLISAGTQVAKLLMDSLAMEQLNHLYTHTEATILDRRHQARVTGRHF